jgi:hypothetical protein
MLTGRPNLWLPTGRTVRRAVNTVFMQGTTQLIDYLAEIEGLIHIATDCWSSTNGFAFMAVVIYYVHNGRVKHLLLDIRAVPEVSNYDLSHVHC